MSRHTLSRILVVSLPAALVLLLALVLTGQPLSAQDARPIPTPIRYSDEVDRPVVEMPVVMPNDQPAPAPVAERSTSFFEDVGRVVWYDRNENKWDLFLSHADGSNRQQLTSSRAVETSPDLQRGGRLVAYASDEAGSDFEIHVMSVTGVFAGALTDNNKDDGQPVWSPDGSRIAFVSERDGQAEVYVMRGNGSEQTRLTFSPGYDGDPTWSPDGSKIAFSSNRSGGYRIYVMDADGSNQTQISTDPVSIKPTWSPNGQYIAYSADADRDGFLDLRLINPDGTEQRGLYNPQGTVDVWARSWAPDNSQVAITTIWYGVYQNQLYIQNTDLDRVELGGISRSITGGVQYPFDPAWQSLDSIPPQSRVTPLPARSPATFTVSWTGSDSGGTDVRSYDVQMRVDGGPWTTWQLGTGETSAEMTGRSGQTFAFRSRARDWHYNLEPWPAGPEAETTIESFPPRTAVFPLEPAIRLGGPFPVVWGGDDPGGSGIVTYDVQYRIGNGAWTAWQTAVAEETAPFGPTYHQVPPGERLAFRVRAVDAAGNVEAWPDRPDTSTITYAWAVEGQVSDNTGRPVAGATVNSTPPAFGPVRSDVGGAYRVMSGATAAMAQLTWTKQGYGALPLTAFDTAVDHRTSVVLPPANDVVVDGGFEAGWPSATWAGSGSLLLARTASARTSGAAGLLFGTEALAFGPATQLSGEFQGWRYGNELFPLTGGRVLAIWGEGGNKYAAERAADGSWSATVNLGPMYNDEWAQDERGVVHVLYEENDDRFMVRRRTLSGVWTAPEVVPGDFAPFIGQFTVGVGDRQAFYGVDVGPHELWIQVRTPSGWQTPELVTESASAGSAFAALTSDGSAHVIWEQGSMGQLYARRRLPNGVWGDAVRLNEPLGRSILQEQWVLADSRGRLHVLWLGSENPSGTGHTYYAVFDGGEWSLPEQTPVPKDRWGQLVLSAADEPRIVVEDSSGALLMYDRDPGRGWLPPTVIPARSYAFVVAVDQLDRTHLVWNQLPEGSPIRQLHYRRIESDGTLSELLPGILESSNYPGVITLVADDLNLPHLLALDEQNGQLTPATIMHAGPALATEPADATITQPVTIPSDMTNPVLSFLYQSSDAATFEVEAGDMLRDLPAAPFGSAHQWLDFSAHAGQTISVTFRLRQAANRPAAWAMLDDVSLGSAHPDVALSGWSGGALSGEQTTLTLTAANPGALPAEPVTLTLDLPTGLSFVSAVPAAESDDPPTWALGALAPGESVTVEVRVQVAQSVVPFSLLRSEALLTTSGELETANNRVELETRVTRTVWLPGIVGE